MFVFIGGVHPKTKTLDEQPQLCPACGAFRLRLKRIDHYFNLFFIPLFPLKKGQPFLICENCGRMFDEHQRPLGKDLGRGGRKAKRCSNCGQVNAPDFSYCPYCGHPL
ncbi:MAG: hypothetical protein B5M54_04030 [Candidatus Aminicenantes bacterium 4484_214]|nr:MAG: hypothetical protein B5M54_04030 [Candidatus Aminicenantes bacterium 4484_214]